MKQKRKKPVVIDTSSHRREQLFEFLNDSPLAYQALDENGCVLSVNDRWLEILGYSRDEVTGRPFTEFIASEENKEFSLRFESFKKKGLANSEFHIVRKNGERILIAFEGRVSKKENGSFSHTVCVLQDITRKRQMERRIEEDEIIFDHFLENSPFYVFFKDKDIRAVKLSRNYEQMLGRPLNEILGKSMDDLFPSDLAKSMIADDQKILNEGKIIEVDEEMNGRYYSTVKFPILIGGEPTYLAGYTLDLTERKKAEMALNESEEKFRSFFELSNVGKSITKITGEIKVNNAFCEMLGYSAFELENKKWQDLTPVEDIPHIEKILSRLIKGETGSLRFEKRYLKKSGEIIWADVGTAIHRDSNGNPLHFITNIVDITDRKNAESALRESEANLAITLNSIGDAVIATDKEGLLTRMNPMAEKLTGWKLEAAKGRHISEIMNIVHSETNKPVSNPVLKVLLNGEIVALGNNVTLISRKGKEYNISDSAAPIRNEKGEIVGVVLVFSDVTEAYSIKKELIVSKETAESYLNVAAEIILSLDKKGNIRLLNDSGHHLLGYNNGELVGKNWFSTCLHHDDKESVRQRFNEMIKGERTSFEQNENRVITKNGELITILWHNTVVRDASGNITGTLSSGEDYTSRKLIEKKLLETNQMLGLILNNIPQRIFWKDLNSTYLGCNNQFAKDANLNSPGDIVGMNDFEMFNKKSAEVFRADDHNVMKSRMAKLGYEESQERKDGTTGWLRTSKVPMTDSEGKVYGILGTYEDITEYKMAIERVRENQQKMESIFRVAPTGIGVVKQRIIIDINPLICEMTGYNREELIGKNSRILYPADEDYEFVGKVKYDEMQVYGKGVVETRWQRKDGSLINIILASTPVEKGNFKGEITFTALDITDRKQAEEEVIQAKEAAEKSDRLKTAFLNNISHEIRTPMNAIVGFSSLLQEEDMDTETGRSYLRIINQSSNHLLAIVNDIVEISSIDAGLLKLNIQSVNLNDLLITIRELFLPKTTEKGIFLKLVTPPDAGDFVLDADPTKTTQIVTNLITNAIKFTSEGGIKFGYKIKPDRVEFFVTDTGLGIDEEYFDKIFDRFYQVHNPGLKLHEGTGLGLSICKAYVKLMGGKIWLKSEKGKGTTFHFTIPLKYDQTKGTK